MPHISNEFRLLIGIFAGTAGFFVTILLIYLGKNIAYKIRLRMPPKFRKGRKPGSKPNFIWWILFVCIGISVIGGAIATSFPPIESETALTIPSIPARDPNKFRIVVTDLDDEHSEYEITNLVVENLENNFTTFPQIEVYQLDDISIPTGEGGQALVEQLGNDLDANIIIWGWYGVSSSITYGIHVEVIETSTTIVPTKICPASFERTQEPIQINEIKDVVINLQNAIPEELSNATFYILGTIYYSGGEWETALSMLNNALDVFGTDTSISAQTQQNEHLIDQDALYYLRAKVNASQGNYHDAISDYKKLLESNTSNLLLNLDLGIWYSAIEDYEKSIQHLDLVLQQEQNPFALYYRGLAYEALTQYEAAKSDFDLLFQNNALLISDFVVDNNIRINDDVLYGLIEVYSKIIAENPNALAYAIRGNAYWHLGNYDAALSDYNGALEFNPNSYIIRFYRSEVFYQTNRHIDQLYDLNILINSEEGSKVPCLFINKGEALVALGNVADGRNEYTKAIELLTQMIAQSPNDYFAYSVRGEAELEIGEYFDGYRDFWKVFRLNPKYAKESGDYDKLSNGVFIPALIIIIILICCVPIIFIIRRYIFQHKLDIFHTKKQKNNQQNRHRHKKK